jgi:hypothetical protein
MDKKIAGLLGAAAALATVGGANAANATAAPENSGNSAANYRELLNPVPNALAALKADDARRTNESTAGAQVAQVTIGVGVGHHHHHHHVMVHHHHHHHVVVVRHPHHHHHHTVIINH